MTGADIVPLHPRTGTIVAERDVVDGWTGVCSDVIRLANVIAETEFVPTEYRGSGPAVAAVILAGRELGIGPMTALRHVQMVKGSPSLSAEYKRARVLAAGHDFEVLELSTQRCRVAGRRKGSGKAPLEITFTMDDARTAGLIKDKGAWKTRPRRMLFARATSELCDFLFSDVVNGLPTAELLTEGGGGDDGYGGYDEPAADAGPARTARRRMVKTPAAGDDTPGHQDVPPSPSGAHPAPATQGTGPGSHKPAEPRAAGPASVRGAQPLTGQPMLPGETPAAQGDDASGEGRSAPPGTEPGSITPPQQAKLHAIFAKLGFGRDDREGRLAVASEITGRELDTSSDLTRDEARALIDTLESCGSRDRLIELMAAASASDEGGQP